MQLRNAFSSFFIIDSRYVTVLYGTHSKENVGMHGQWC